MENNQEHVHFKYVIKMTLGDLSKGKNGWSKQANIIKWNNGLFKLDIRDWNSTKQQMRRGITLTRSEVQALVNLLKNIDMRLIDDYEIEQVRTATFRMPTSHSIIENIQPTENTQHVQTAVQISVEQPAVEQPAGENPAVKQPECEQTESRPSVDDLPEFMPLDDMSTEPTPVIEGNRELSEESA